MTANPKINTGRDFKIMTNDIKHDMKTEEFLKIVDEHNNGKSYGLCPQPFPADKGLDVLIEHFLGKDWPTTLSMSSEQAYTEAIADILYKTQRKSFFMKQTWSDVYFGKFKWYRKMRKGAWYKHQFTKDAEELTFPQGDTWWARYGKINRYSDVIETEVY